MLSRKKVSRQVQRQQARKQIKELRTQEKKEEQILRQIKIILESVFDEDNIKLIAKKTKLSLRTRKLTPLVIVSILLMGCSCEIGSQSICQLRTMSSFLRKWFNIHIKTQSLQAKINRKETSDFIKAIMAEVVKHETNKILGKIFKKTMKKNKKKTKKLNKKLFKRILLQDSTVISLPESLSKMLRGCGGTASKAAIKCDFTIDQTNHLILSVRFSAGRNPDVSFSGNIIDDLQNKDLVIRDLGYFKLSVLKDIMNENAYFISRLSKVALVYLNKNDEEPLDIMKKVEILNIEKKKLDIDVFIGQTDRIPARLIGIKVPPEVVEARRHQYKKARGKKEPSEELIEWNGYTFMITNIPKDDLSLKQILKIYKIRWQIELFFKNMKSNLCIDNLTGKNKYRILCIIYTKLVLTWIVLLLYAYAQTKVDKGKEVSLFKFTDWLKVDGKLKNALLTQNLSNLLHELDRDLNLLYKEKKKSRNLSQLTESNKKIKYRKAA